MINQFYWTTTGMDLADNPGVSDSARYVRLKDHMTHIREYRNALAQFTDDVDGLIDELKNTRMA